MLRVQGWRIVPGGRPEPRGSVRERSVHRVTGTDLAAREMASPEAGMVESRPEIASAITVERVAQSSQKERLENDPG